MDLSKERLVRDVGPEVIGRVATARLYDSEERLVARTVGRIQAVSVADLATGHTVGVAFGGVADDMSCNGPGWYMTIEVAS